MAVINQKAKACNSELVGMMQNIKVEVVKWATMKIVAQLSSSFVLNTAVVFAATLSGVSTLMVRGEEE